MFHDLIRCTCVKYIYVCMVDACAKIVEFARRECFVQSKFCRAQLIYVSCRKYRKTFKIAKIANESHLVHYICLIQRYRSFFKRQTHARWTQARKAHARWTQTRKAHARMQRTLKTRVCKDQDTSCSVFYRWKCVFLTLMENPVG